MASQTQPTSAATLGWPATQLAWVGRQLLLVPEAVLFLTLLCLHATLGPSLTLVGLGLCMVFWFATRVSLLYAARRAVESAHYERAQLMATIALCLHPLSADAHALIGTVRLSQGDPQAAIHALSRAVRYYPLQADLHAALSAALLEDGRPRDALLAASAALLLDPGYAPAYLHQASAEDLLDASAEQIERHLRAGLQHAAAPADEAALRCALARVLLRRGSVAEARLALLRAEKLLPASQPSQRAGLHFQIGEALRIAGDGEAARTHFSASETIDPHGPYAAAAWRAARS